MNETRSQGYVYLIDSSGEIIYHPRQNLLYSQLAEENNRVNVTYKDGTIRETFAGEDRLVSIQTVSYTGWKIVCVMPYNTAIFRAPQTRYYVVMIVTTIILLMLLISFIVSLMITKPLHRLTESIRVTKDGVLNPEIYICGNSDVEYLGCTLKQVTDQFEPRSEYYSDRG